MPKSNIAVRAQQWLSRCLVRAWLEDTVVLGGLCLTGCLLTFGGELAWGEDLLGSASAVFWGAESVLRVELSRVVASVLAVERDQGM